ncbi:MAG: hypothetical protein R2932_13695 [Caldilineaceae bacterium]
MIRFFRLLRRLAVTVTMLFVLMGTALWSATHSARILPAFVTRMGFAVEDFWLLHWERFFTSALITHGERAFWGASFMVALAVGLAEWRTGTRRAFFTFWGVHLFTLLLLALTIGLWQRSSVQPLPSIPLRDVGPSAGYVACLGLLSQPCPTRGEELILVAAGCASWHEFSTGIRRCRSCRKAFRRSRPPDCVPAWVL